MFTDADRTLAQRAARQDGVFTRGDALSCGLTDEQVDLRVAKVWTQLSRGVFLAAGAPLPPKAMLRAVCLAGAPNAAASHRSAAALYDLPGGRVDLAEVTCPRWLRVRYPGLVVHESNRIDAVDVRLVDGIPVMRPERVLIELASIYKSPGFIEVVLHAMRRKRLVTYDSTQETFLRLAKRGRRGSKVVRVVLDRWDPADRVTETPPETLLYRLLKDAGFGRVVPQFEVCDEAGAVIGRPDVGLPDDRILVEYESDQEHTDEMSLARDNLRRNKLMAMGWIVIGARKADLRNGGQAVLAAITAHRRSNLRHEPGSETAT